MLFAFNQIGIQETSKKLIVFLLLLHCYEILRCSTGRTARERWKLFKNISKIGLQRYNTNDVIEVSWKSTKKHHRSACMSTDSRKIMFKIYFVSLQTEAMAYNSCKRKPSIYGSRHLTYDIPFPIDECNTDDIEIRRRPSRRHHTNRQSLLFGRSTSKKSSPFRTVSLNVREQKTPERMPVARNISSPTTLQYANNQRYAKTVFRFS